MDSVKITKRDNYNTLYEIVTNAGLDPEIENRLHTFIDHELELMAARNEKAKKYQKAHNAAEDELSKAIFSLLQHSTEPMSTREICAKIEGATPQKVTYRMSKLFDQGWVTKDTQSTKDENGVTRRATFYKITDNIQAQG